MMWMMGYNDGGDFNSIQDPFAGHGKLRPLIPRPATAAAVATSSPCLARIHGTDVLALNHHLAMVEQNKRDQLNTQQVVVSSRWNPTPEQLQTLEELYRRGTRTPSAEQIQQITAQLRRYGKIEGKNVFYWFQNHKARERQKRRRQHDEQQQQPHYVNGDKREAPGANRTVFEVEQTKNWASPTNSSTVLAERGICTQGAAAAGAKAAAAAEASECKADGWVHFDEEEDDDTDMLLQHRRNATWQSMHLSSCSSSSSPTNLVNTSSAPPTVANCAATIIPSTFGTILETSKPPHQDNLINIFFKPYSSQSFEDHSAAAVGGEEAQTLQLFPLQSGRSRHRQWADEEEDDDEEEEGSDVGMSTNSCRAPPYQFFEFLPLKN